MTVYHVPRHRRLQINYRTRDIRKLDFIIDMFKRKAYYNIEEGATDRRSALRLLVKK